VTTFGDLIDEVISTLQGHTTDVPNAVNLAGDVTSTSTELALESDGQAWAGRPTGIVEIGSELIYVSRYDPNSGVAVVPPWGRGYRNTVATAHNADSMVTIRPRYPRAQVAKTVNSVVQASCPPLFSARDLAPIETSSLVELGYPLPADTVRVLRVDATDLGVEDLADRRVLRNWSVRTVAGTQLLEISDCEIYQSIQVTIAANPGLMVAETDDFAAVTGLSEAAADLVIFGALARLILGAELARQQTTSVEAQARSEKVPAGSATTISRFYQAMYTQRLEAERDRLLQHFPLTVLRRG
jgi:hypothetical protein